MRRAWWERLAATIAATATAFGIACTFAVAAPPQDPPGNSGNAPGHAAKDKSEAQAEATSPSADAPGQAKRDDPAPPAPEASTSTETTPQPVEAVVEQKPTPKAKATAKPANDAPAPQSPRFTNARGDAKKNVPPEAHAAPVSSQSQPGNSGVHKLTICHNGHAITVDVHAAAAHAKHGDTYVPAGTKGRARCGATTPKPPTPRPPSTQDDPKGPPDDPKRPDDTKTPRTPVAETTVADATTPTTKPDGAVLGVTPTRRPASSAGILASAAVLEEQLPFTGSKLAGVAALGLLLTLLGVALVARTRTPRDA